MNIVDRLLTYKLFNNVGFNAETNEMRKLSQRVIG